MTKVEPIKCESCGALIYDKDKDRVSVCSYCQGHSRKDGNLSRRKKATANRYGQAQRFLDAVQELIRLKDDVCGDFESDKTFAGLIYKKETVEKMLSILNELRKWDVTENGSLYLTSGGRVVLDMGYGEYFNDGDIELFSLEQLHSGMRLDDFQAMLDQAKEQWQEGWPEDESRR